MKKSILYLIFILGIFVLQSPVFSDALDDLSESEIAQTVKTIHDSKLFSPDIRFPSMLTAEPVKFERLKKNVNLARKAFATVYDKKKNIFYEVLVNLDNSKIEAHKLLKDLQPPVLMEEYDKVDKLVRQNKLWQTAIRKRGISNFDDVYVDGWAPGLRSKIEIHKKSRLMRALTYYKAKGPIYYTRPVEGILATVDMNQEKVIEVKDTGVVPVAEGAHDFSKKVALQINPILLSQPAGHSFKIKGQKVEWDNWRFRYSFQQMKGLVLFDVHYLDGKNERPILSKASLSEMVVPYGDSDVNWAFRNAFDVGEYGLARSAHTLELGKDIPSTGLLLDAVFADDLGGTVKVPKAIGIYERDGGVLWKHMDQNTRASEMKRATDLVVTFTSTIGNYDYGISWVFKEDASIEVEVHLTGILLSKGTAITKNPCEQECKHLVEKNIIAPTHQHFFAFRLDFDVDGVENSAVEIDANAIAIGKLNPFANAFESFLRVIKNEKESGRDFNFQKSRKWKVVSKNVKNALGHPTGYAILPGENAATYLNKLSPIRKRAGFLDHPVWFTRYHDEEQSAGGEYPNQSAGGDGLKKWASNAESLEGEDIVMWYVLGITHIPRPEDWPVMPTHRASFKLIPVNFFNQNPNLAHAP